MRRSVFSFLVAGLWSTGALAQKPHMITVEVTGPDGFPISNAVIRVDSIEGDTRHRVNQQTGRWSASALHAKDTDELVYLQPGDQLEFSVHAPGYHQQRISYLLPRSRRSLLSISLEDMVWWPAAEATEEEKNAFLDYAAWRHANDSYLENPSEETVLVDFTARRVFNESLQRWLDVDPSSEIAWEICCSSTDRREDCK